MTRIAPWHRSTVEAIVETLREDADLLEAVRTMHAFRYDYKKGRQEIMEERKTGARDCARVQAPMGQKGIAYDVNVLAYEHL